MLWRNLSDKIGGTVKIPLVREKVVFFHSLASTSCFCPIFYEWKISLSFHCDFALSVFPFHLFLFSTLYLLLETIFALFGTNHRIPVHYYSLLILYAYKDQDRSMLTLWGEGEVGDKFCTGTYCSEEQRMLDSSNMIYFSWHGSVLSQQHTGEQHTQVRHHWGGSIISSSVSTGLKPGRKAVSIAMKETC